MLVGVSTPAVRNPRQATVDGFDILYVDGRRAPWCVTPHDPEVRDQLPPGMRTLAMCRRRCDAVTAITSGEAARVLASRLNHARRSAQLGAGGMKPQPMRLDPTLPCVTASSLNCPHCGQTYQTIMEDKPGLPERHYVRPTRVTSAGTTKVTVRSASNPGNRSIPTKDALCPVGRDVLVALILRAQWELVGRDWRPLVAS